MGILGHIDARADELLRDDHTPHEAWTVLCREFPDAHSNLLAERVAAAAIVAGWTRTSDGQWCG